MRTVCGHDHAVGAEMKRWFSLSPNDRGVVQKPSPSLENQFVFRPLFNEFRIQIERKFWRPIIDIRWRYRRSWRRRWSRSFSWLRSNRYPNPSRLNTSRRQRWFWRRANTAISAANNENSCGGQRQNRQPANSFDERVPKQQQPCWLRFRACR